MANLPKTSRELADLILNSNGRIFTVTFTKRTTGEVRVMVARTGVTKHLKTSEGPVYDFKEKGLISVWDLAKEGYRAIPVEGLLGVKINGETHILTKE